MANKKQQQQSAKQDAKAQP
ncbi:hypothetical protein Gpo141_00015048, partial [Globisporangium polare]